MDDIYLAMKDGIKHTLGEFQLFDQFEDPSALLENRTIPVGGRRETSNDLSSLQRGKVPFDPQQL